MAVDDYGATVLASMWGMFFLTSSKSLKGLQHLPYERYINSKSSSNRLPPYVHSNQTLEIRL